MRPISLAALAGLDSVPAVGLLGPKLTEAKK